MKVLAINGSPRKGGNTEYLLKTVLDVLESEGIETELIQIGGTNIRGCTACGKCIENKDKRCAVDGDIFNDVFIKMLEADGLLLGSPTYFTDVTAEMKALIDRSGYVAAVNRGLFRHKVGAAVVAVRRGGAIHVFDTINHFFLISQMVIPGSIYWNMGFGLNKGEIEQDEEGLKTMQILGQNIAWLLRKTAT